MAHTFKVGDRIILAREVDGIRAGTEVAVTFIEPSGYTGTMPVQVNGRSWLTEDHLDLIGSAPAIAKTSPSPSKADRLIAAKEAELARLKEAAAKRAKLAAERKAKADRAKVLAGLSAAGKRVVAMLQAGAASDFGCQRDNVILLAAAITGDKADAIKKALA